MIEFSNGMDVRCRSVNRPMVARIYLGQFFGGWRYCVIGTQYGYWHTTSGDVRTWKTASGAYRAIKRYTPL